MKRLRIRPGQGNFATTLEIYLDGKWWQVGDDDAVYRLALLAKKRGVVWEVNPLDYAGGDFSVYLKWEQKNNCTLTK